MTTIKRKPINLTMPVQLRLAPVEDQTSVRSFSIEAYTGAVIDSWFGKLAFDISGMSSRKKIPVLREHARDRVVGYGTGIQDGKSFFVNGVFSKTTRDAKESLALADEGYPWQASVGIRPVRVRTLADTEEMQVNGQMLKGPAEIWLKSEVGEVSFVSLGADSNTSVSVFSESEIEIEAELEISPQTEGPCDTACPQKETVIMTKDELMEQAPELVQELRAEGATEERARVTQILASDPEMKHFAVLKQAIEAGTSKDAIFKALFEAERQFRQTGLRNLADQATPSVGQSRTETETASAPKTFFGEVADEMKAHNLSRADAVRKVQSEQPALHQAFLKEQTK